MEEGLGVIILRVRSSVNNAFTRGLISPCSSPRKIVLTTISFNPTLSKSVVVHGFCSSFRIFERLLVTVRIIDFSCTVAGDTF